MENVGWDEAKEIAAHILNVKDDEEDDYAAIEDALFEKWEIDLETFRSISDAIFKHVDFSISPLTHKAFVGISKPGEWFVKKEVNQQFINGLISWATEGEQVPANSKGFLREITLNGKVEFEIVIRRPESN